jgi:hypothetical protein
MDKNWIEKATKNKGALHKALGVASDKKTPEKKLDKALHSKNMKIIKEASLDKTLRSFRTRGK